jgi:PAS domain S-box-containing protein
LSGIRQEHAFRDAATRPVNEPLFADAFENAPHAMAILATDGRIMQANGALCRMLGFSRNELEAMNASDIAHSDDVTTEAEQRRRLASADIGRYELALRYLRKDGEFLWVRLSASATRRNAGEPSCLVAQIERIPPHNCPDAVDLGDGWLTRFGDATLSAIHEIGNSLTPLMLSAEMIVEQSNKKDVIESAHQIFNAARRIAFTLRRLRHIHNGQPVAYVGESRMLDLRMVAPPNPVERKEFWTE